MKQLSEIKPKLIIFYKAFPVSIIYYQFYI